MTTVFPKVRLERLAGRWGRKLRRRYGASCVNIVTYHSIGPDCGSIHPCGHTQADFERNIDYLVEHCNIISLRSLVETLERREFPERAAVITFDDGYADTLHRAVPMLYRRRIPMTIFLTTSAVGNHDLLWHHKLAWLTAQGHARRVEDALSAEGITGRHDQETLENFARRCYRCDLPSVLESVLRSVGQSGAVLAAKLRPYVEPEEIASVDPEFVTFGNHTHTHPVLSALSYEEQHREITVARDEILSLTGEFPLALAYPFGLKRHYDANSKLIAQETWHRAALNMRRRSNIGPADPFELSRKPAPAGSQRLFEQMIEDGPESEQNTVDGN